MGGSAMDFAKLQDLLSQGADDDEGRQEGSQNAPSSSAHTHAAMHPGMFGPQSTPKPSSSSARSSQLVVKSASEQTAVTVDADGNAVEADNDPLGNVTFFSLSSERKGHTLVTCC
jgi:hypothetical protein